MALAGDEKSETMLPDLSKPYPLANIWLLSGALSEDRWIKDWRLGMGNGPDLVEAIKDKKMANSRIGVLQLYQGPRTVRGLGEPGVYGPWNAPPLGTYLKNALPQATFVEMYDEFVSIWLTHSPEEIEMCRKAALALEIASEAYVEAAKPRNTLSDVRLAVLESAVPYGVSINDISLYSHEEGGRGSRWQERGFPPGVIKKGHVLESELTASCGHMEAQVQIAVAVGQPSKDVETLGRMARECIVEGVKVLRPGNTFGAVCDAMDAVNIKAGAWNLTPFLHTMNPLEAVSMMRDKMWEEYTGLKERFGEARIAAQPTYLAELVLQEGMTFAFEPNSMFGRTYVNIGGTAVITKDGCEELNDIANWLVVVDA